MHMHIQPPPSVISYKQTTSQMVGKKVFRQTGPPIKVMQGKAM